LKVEQFQELVAALMPVYAKLQQERLKKSNRERKAGGGRKFELGFEERLLLTLMYLRLYVSQTLLGYIFELDDSNVSREINRRMIPSLKAVLPLPMQDELLTPSVQAHAKKRIGTLKELLEAQPEFKEVLVDATEQDVPKPSDKLKRKQRYSGKKKRHTLKSRVAVSNRLVLHLSNYLSMSLAQFMISASFVLQGLFTVCKLSSVNCVSTKVMKGLKMPTLMRILLNRKERNVTINLIPWKRFVTNCSIASESLSNIPSLSYKNLVSSLGFTEVQRTAMMILSWSSLG
jgi:hypothetical protein